MSADAWVTIVIVAGVVAALARGAVSPVAGVLGGAVALVLTGVLEAERAFAGFSNPALPTIAALSVVARALQRSGALDAGLRLAVRGDGRSGLVRLLVPVAGASAVVNNTPIVAALAPSVHAWARRLGRPPSRYLMPLSYVTILGGVVTTIGTSTNLVVSGLLVEAGQEPFGLFEMTPIGLPIAIVGLVVLVLTSRHLLPDREAPAEQVLGEQRRYATVFRVDDGGPVDGVDVAAAGLRDLGSAYLAAVERDGRELSPVPPDLQLQGGDELVFVGDASSVAVEHPGLRATEHQHVELLDDPRLLVEAVVGANASLRGRTLREVAFRERFGAAVLAVHRNGDPLRGSLGRTPLRAGDALLLRTDTGFVRRWQARDEFAVLAPLGDVDPEVDRRTGWVAVLALVGAVALAGLGVVDIVNAALGAAVVVLVSGGISLNQARTAVDLDVLLVVGGSFALGAAIESSGLAATLGDALGGLSGSSSPVVAIAAVVLGTMILTEPLSNAAAAALMLPIALDVAPTIGVDPRTLAVAVAIAASTSFLTPIGYQTNTMVFGLGGYRFGDYARLGLPLTIVCFVAITLGALLVGS